MTGRIEGDPGGLLIAEVCGHPDVNLGGLGIVGLDRLPVAVDVQLELRAVVGESPEAGYLECLRHVRTRPSRLPLVAVELLRERRQHGPVVGAVDRGLQAPVTVVPAETAIDRRAPAQVELRVGRLLEGQPVRPGLVLAVAGDEPPHRGVPQRVEHQLELDDQPRLLGEGVLVDLDLDLRDRGLSHPVERLGQVREALRDIGLHLPASQQRALRGVKKGSVGTGRVGAGDRPGDADPDRLVVQAVGRVDRDHLLEVTGDLAWPHDDRQHPQPARRSLLGVLYLVGHPLRGDGARGEEDAGDVRGVEVGGQLLIEQVGRFDVEEVHPRVGPGSFDDLQQPESVLAVSGAVGDEDLGRFHVASSGVGHSLCPARYRRCPNARSRLTRM